MALRFYYDLFSQPSRSIYIFLNKSRIAFQPCVVDLMAGEQFAPDFKKNASKFQKVPFIHHGDFRLAESTAIMKYLTNIYPVEDYWYPKDPKQQARVEEYLAWHSFNLRLHCVNYFWTVFIKPMASGKPAPPEKEALFLKHVVKILKSFEELFLSESRFIVGNTISYADLHAACEIEQMRITEYNIPDNHPRIKTWLDEVRSHCNPYYDEAHSKLIELGQQVFKKTSKL